ncbi:DUF6603 domain-containing protein [Kribbella sp. NPDC056951]|uniref:DUF6603 domain-containing protein n=1 Tax=Kribbella sp. NPDC056951 TaxID=3345978 RepID=UPI003641AB03
MAGSVEKLAVEVGRFLEPITSYLKDNQIAALYGELGLPVSPAIANDPAVVASAKTALSALTAVPPKVEALQQTGSAEALADLLRVIPPAFWACKVMSETVKFTVNASGPLSDPIKAVLVDLPDALINYTATTYLLSAHPGFAKTAVLFGLIDNDDIARDGDRPPFRRRRLRFDRLGTFLRSPADSLKEQYGWGRDDLDAEKFLEAITEALLGWDLPAVFIKHDDGVELASFLFRVRPVPDAAPDALRILLDVFDFSGFDLDLALFPGWKTKLKGSGSLNVGPTLRLEPPGELVPEAPGAGLNGKLALELGKGPIQLIGTPEGSGLSVKEIKFSLGTAFGGEAAGVVAEADLVGGKLLVDFSKADGFLSTVLKGAGTKLEADFDLGITIDSNGLSFRGNGGLEIQIPLHLKAGPVELTTLYIGVGVQGGSIPLELSAGFKAALGPIQASVDRMGLTAELSFPAGGGNLGPAELTFGFKPPSGVGLKVDVGVITGGGYLYADPDKGEYAGALELKFAGFLELKAIGLISTRMPDGTDGFSLLIIITAEFPGGLQLGFGFTLLAVGGLVGINRRMNLDALAKGVRSNAIESVMFPKDVVANAPRIISDLRSFFPAEKGKFLIGPMAKIGWGTPTLLSISIGVIIEIPGNIAIVGVLRCILPAKELPLLVIQVNFIGAIEFDKQRLWFNAVLFESRILMMTIEGGMGLLVGWGDDADLVLSVGGFHPSYKPPNLPFDVPPRLAVDILNQPGRRIRVEGYFALTSNTVQFGAAAELVLGFDDFGIHGHLAFDALFRFSPFSFVIAISASVSLKAFGVGLFGIDLYFELSGPSPWRAHGRGSISLLFFEISADFDISWGESNDTTLPPVAVLPILAAEFAKLEGWETRLPTGGVVPLVTLRNLPDSDELVLHPLGTLFVRQRAIPLEIRMDRLGAQEPSDGRRFSIEPADGSGLRRVTSTGEKFAMAQFQTMDDAAKLSRPAYEQQNAGIELAASTGALATTHVVRRSARYELIITDNTPLEGGTTAMRAATVTSRPGTRKRFHNVNPVLFGQFTNGSSVARSPLSQQTARNQQPYAASETVRVTGKRFVVAYVRNNLQAFPPTNPDADGTFRSQSGATEALDRWIEIEPSLAGTLHVIGEDEAAGPLAVPQSWAPAGTTPAVSGTTAVRLTGGRVMIAGGTDAEGKAVKDTAIYDPVANSWLPGPALTKARRRHTVTGLTGGKVLVVGGLSDTDELVGTSELFDPLSGKWTEITTTGRFGHSATVLAGGNVLVAGGNDGRTMATAAIFDVASNKWVPIDSMHEAREDHQAVALAGDLVLVTGGATATGPGARAAISYCELYDVAAKKWTPVAGMNVPRVGHQATAIKDGTAVLVTGGDAPAFLIDGEFDPRSRTSAEVFQLDDKSWKTAADLPVGRSRHQAVALRTGGVLVVGGASGPSFDTGFAGALRYDPAADTWTTTGALVTGRWGHTAITLADGRVLVAGGTALAGTATPEPGTDVQSTTAETYLP